MNNVFEVTIQETLERTITVEAASREAAERIVRQRWKESAYKLGSKDAVGVIVRHRMTPEFSSAR